MNLMLVMENMAGFALPSLGGFTRGTWSPSVSSHLSHCDVGQVTGPHGASSSAARNGKYVPAVTLSLGTL